MVSRGKNESEWCFELELGVWVGVGAEAVRPKGTSRGIHPGRSIIIIVIIIIIIVIVVVVVVVVVV